MTCAVSGLVPQEQAAPCFSVPFQEAGPAQTEWSQRPHGDSGWAFTSLATAGPLTALEHRVTKVTFLKSHFR